MTQKEYPLISIIVPVYNVEKYLNKCLDTIVHQTYSNLQIICVNDGSLDNSIDILRSYATRDKRIILIEQKNIGLSGARNAGMKLATGDYIMFVDSDDWIDLNVCEEAIRENVDVVFWSYYREYPERCLLTSLYGNQRIEWDETSIQELQRRMVGLSGKELKNPAQTDSMITLWGKLYKHDVIQNIDFVDTNLIASEDTLFNINVFFKVKSAVYLPSIHYHYRKDNVQSFTSGRYKKDHVEKWRELYKRIKEQLIEQKMDTTFYVALENRRALGVLQLGMGISGDLSMSFGEKRRELKKILTSPDYLVALKQLELKDMPFHWKVFFVSAKKRLYSPMLILLKVMKWLRSRS